MKHSGLDIPFHNLLLKTKNKISKSNKEVKSEGLLYLIIKELLPRYLVSGTFYGIKINLDRWTTYVMETLFVHDLKHILTFLY